MLVTYLRGASRSTSSDSNLSATNVPLHTKAEISTLRFRTHSRYLTWGDPATWRPICSIRTRYWPAGIDARFSRCKLSRIISATDKTYREWSSLIEQRWNLWTWMDWMLLPIRRSKENNQTGSDRQESLLETLNQLAPDPVHVAAVWPEGTCPIVRVLRSLLASLEDQRNIYQGISLQVLDDKVYYQV